MEKIYKGFMKLKTEIKARTKLQYNSGASLTTVPAAITNFLDTKTGDFLVWTLKIKDGKPELSIELESKND